MLTGEIRAQVDRVWDAFWTGGISNPLEVIEQFTYLLFIKRLDELHTVREAKANRQRQAIENPIFTPDQAHLRWSRFKNMPAPQLYTVIEGEVFPFMKTLGGDGGGAFASAYSAHMKDARFTLPPEKAGLLARVVDMIDRIPMDDRDTKGDLYEYMLSKLSTSGQNGQFRTPRHIIKMMVELTEPRPTDTLCDPACGTAGFLVAAAEYLEEHHPEVRTDPALRERYYGGRMFHGFDFDSTMLRIATMNLLLHGIEQPAIENRDSLSQGHAGVAGQYTLVLANPPFAGSLDYEAAAKDLLSVVKTKKTELLFLALCLRLLKPGGRAAVIVPDGVLFGSSTAHRALRRMLVEDHRLEGVISMPSGVFKPYSGVSTGVLLFTRTDSGGTDDVWFYDMKADGYSLDDKRTPLAENKNRVSTDADIATTSDRNSVFKTATQNRGSTDALPATTDTRTPVFKTATQNRGSTDALPATTDTRTPVSTTATQNRGSTDAPPATTDTRTPVSTTATQNRGSTDAPPTTTDTRTPVSTTATQNRGSTDALPATTSTRTPVFTTPFTDSTAATTGDENLISTDQEAESLETGFSRKNPVSKRVNDIPDILARWRNRDAERARARTDQSFLVPKAEIAAQGYDLSLNRYKEVVYDDVAHDPPLVILAELEALEEEIRRGLGELRGMLA